MNLPHMKPSHPHRKRFLMILSIILMASLTSIVMALVPQRLIKAGEHRIERAWMIFTGDLIDIGGHYMRIEQKGEGGPTVVFEPGLSQTRDTWGAIPDEVAKVTGVAVYDRAGVGESDPVSFPRTTRQIINDLHNLLIRANVAKPYILVGHSFGGLNVRLFACQYPDEVAGMVLIDPSHEEQFMRYAELMPAEKRIKYIRHERGANEERVDMFASAHQVKLARRLPTIPTVIITAGIDHKNTNYDRSEQIHQELQASLVRLIPGSRQIIAEKSGHFIQKDQPELVIKAIRELVEAARAKKKLM